MPIAGSATGEHRLFGSKLTASALQSSRAGAPDFQVQGAALLLLLLLLLPRRSGRTDARSGAAGRNSARTPKKPGPDLLGPAGTPNSLELLSFAAAQIANRWDHRAPANNGFVATILLTTLDIFWRSRYQTTFDTDTILTLLALALNNALVATILLATPDFKTKKDSIIPGCHQSKSKHLKGQLGPRVSHVFLDTFRNQGIL